VILGKPVADFLRNFTGSTRRRSAWSGERVIRKGSYLKHAESATKETEF
jgi:hypothetical protein